MAIGSRLRIDYFTIGKIASAPLAHADGPGIYYKID